MLSCTEKIAQFIKDYYQNTKIVTEEYVKELSSIIIKNENLEDCIKNVTCSEKNTFCEISAQHINIDLKDFIITYKSPKIKCLTQEDLNIEQFMSITNDIIHEFIHALQFKNYQIIENSIERSLITKHYQFDRKALKYYEGRESKLYKYYLFKQAKNFQMKYLKYYDLCPIERIVSIDSLIECISILKILKTPNLEEYYNSLLTEEYFHNYNYTSNPTLLYCLCTNLYLEAIKIIKEENNFDLNTRLRLGLGIKDEEYSILTKQLVKNL